MKTPKESFLLTGGGAALKKIVEMDLFDTACDYAMLQLLSEQRPNIALGQPADALIGLDANAQMKGAARLLEILKTLHEPIEQKKPAKRPTISYA